MNNKKNINIIVGGCVIPGHKDLGIGTLDYHNRLTMLWCFKEDMDQFKTITNSQIVIMGRVTWDTIEPKPLKNRINIIISKSEFPTSISNSILNDTKYVKSMKEAIDFCDEIYPNKDIFIIGGEQIYNLVIDQYQNRLMNIFITKVNKTYRCDRYFPLHKLEKIGLKLMHETENRPAVNTILGDYLIYQFLVYRLK